MQRIYLILRNNNQTGPFTIDELLQQQLKTSDMLWIEGQSTAWAYLSELELKLPTHEPPDVKQKEISGSKSLSSADEIEIRAEELRKKAMSFSPPHYYLDRSPVRNNETYFYNTDPSREETVHIIEHSKKKYSALKEFLVLCFLMMLFAFGVYKGKSIFNEKGNAPNPERGIVISNDEHQALQKTPVILKPNIDTVANATSRIKILITKPKNRPPQKHKKQVNKNIITNIEPITIAHREDAVPVEQVPIEDLQKKQIVSPDQKAITAEPVEKKKTFIQTIKGLFRKKKKEDNQGVSKNK